MNKTVSILEKMEENGFIKNPVSGMIGGFTFSDISLAFLEEKPWLLLGYKSYATMNVFLDREIPGYNRKRGEKWGNILLGEMPDHLSINGVGINDVDDKMTQEGSTMPKRYYGYYNRMTKFVSAGDATMCKEWYRLSVFREWFESQNPPKGSRMKTLYGHYSPTTIRFMGGEYER